LLIAFFPPAADAPDQPNIAVELHHIPVASTVMQIVHVLGDQGEAALPCSFRSDASLDFSQSYHSQTSRGFCAKASGVASFSGE
jgi:hypothetical protein